MSKIYRHKKTGGLYIVLHQARMQSKHWFDRQQEETEVHNVKVDMAEVVVYQSVNDELVWVRPRAEFYDRFEVLNRTEHLEDGKITLLHSDAF